ncbi:hypothetical protein GW17_00044503 [Ensete ventricosum]|nr:hypothetical protein GW17_00044503 [Ensete ventricosum]
MHRVNAVGNSLGVHRELAKGIGSLSGWRKGVHQKKIETRRKIIGGRRKLAGRIRKLAGNMSGDYRKKTIGLAARISEAAGLAGSRESTLPYSIAMLIDGSIVGMKGCCEDVDEALNIEKLGGSDGGAVGSSFTKGCGWRGRC